MTNGMNLCERYERGDSAWDNDLTAGGYLAAVHCEVLPAEMYDFAHIVRRGYAVGFGQWFFFEDLPPAVAFGRAARMSMECNSYGIYEAAHETIHCPDHGDERVLLLTGGNVDRIAREVFVLKRFVQGVKEHQWSSNWHGVTGYITRMGGDGQPVRTRERSLPL